MLYEHVYCNDTKHNNSNDYNIDTHDFVNDDDNETFALYQIE